MTDLCDLSHPYEALANLGFQSREEETADTVRRVTFFRVFQTPASQVRMVLEVRYDLLITDNINPMYGNQSYDFEEVCLGIENRNMELEEDTNDLFDENTETPRPVGWFPTDIRTLYELKRLSCFLDPPYREWVVSPSR